MTDLDQPSGDSLEEALADPPDGPRPLQMPDDLRVQVYELLYPTVPYGDDLARVLTAQDQLGDLAQANPDHAFTIGQMGESLHMLAEAIKQS